MEIILTQQAKDLHKQGFGDFTPTLSTLGSAGYDVRACIDKEITLYPNSCTKIPLGFKLAIGTASQDVPTAALVLPRSGLGSNNGIVLGNLVGLIDSDYQQEWICSVWNRTTEEQFVITPGMRIAQVIFIPVIHPVFIRTEAFEYTSTRTGGFNSTGTI